MINAATIFSTLGNPNSLIPLAIKDTSATAGMTAGSFITGREEGQDRLIDELGTAVIWLLGIPAFKWIINHTLFKACKLDHKFDARNLDNKDIFNKTKEFAPTDEVKKSIEKISDNKKLFKYAAGSRFIISTALTVITYLGLTKFKQKYTEKTIRENLIREYNEKKSPQTKQDENSSKTGEKVSKTAGNISQTDKNPSFKGNFIESLAFSPVRNMWILDGFITGARLKESRSPQEFAGYAIKEAFTLCFMYYAGGKIQKMIENYTKKKFNLSIELDARVIEDSELKKAFEDGSIAKSIQDFKNAGSSEVNLYEFLHKNPDNMIVKTAVKSDIISLYKNTGKIDTRKYIDLKEAESLNKKVEELYGQYKKALSSGGNSEKFFKDLRKLKRGSVIANMGSCILALGIIAPAVMLLKRFTAKDDSEFQTKKEIRQQLIKEGIIV